jgi:hypothetical protein
VQVEEGLGRVLAAAIAGIYDGRARVAGRETGRPGGGVAYDDGVRPESV